MNLEAKIFKPVKKVNELDSGELMYLNGVEELEQSKQAEQRIKTYFKDRYSDMHKEQPELFEFVRKYKSDAYFLPTATAEREEGNLLVSGWRYA